MKQDFEEQYKSLFGMARRRLLRLLQVKQLARKHFKVHQQRFLNRLMKEQQNGEGQVDLQDQEAKIKMLIQAKIEPVDIREVDEDEMNWTLNDSMDHECVDTENSRTV